MHDIKELVQFVAFNNLQQALGSGMDLDKKSKVGALFWGIAEGNIQTDEDALWLLYQTKEDTSTYRKTKSNLRERLVESILRLDTSTNKFSDYQQAYFECHKYWTSVKILTGQNMNVAAMALAKRLLKQTVKYDFVLLSMDIASYLRTQYALREGDDKRFSEMNDLFVHFRQMYDAECMAEELYVLLVAKHINSRSPKEQAGKTIEGYYVRLEPLLQRFDSYRLHLYGRLIGLMRYTTAHNFASALAFCDDAIRFFKSKPYEARVPVQIFLYEKLICHVQLRHFEEGRDAAQECAKYLKEGTFNWFKYLELVTKLAMHTEQYQDASEVIVSIPVHPRYEFLPENVKEIWRINDAYMYLLIVLGKVKPPSGYVFKSGRLFNELPIFSKDKAGMNIAILIIRFLLMIAENKRSQLYDELESLDQYCYRYIKTPQTLRSFNFIKALLQIPAGYFDWEEVEKRAKRYLDKLKDIPVQVADQVDEIEIIPYEILWELARELVRLR